MKNSKPITKLIPRPVPKVKRRNRNRAPKRSRVKLDRRLPRYVLPQLTHAGECFLKCAFAAPDSNVELASGIPDNYNGKSLLKRTIDQTAVTFPNGRTTYLLLVPMPGYSYFALQLPIGVSPSNSAQYVGQPCSDYVSVFPSVPNLDTNVVKYRYMSNAIEIVPTMNDMTWAGSIQCFKIPITLGTSNHGGTFYPTVQGMEGVGSHTGPRYIAPFRNGVYAMATNSEPDFPFDDFMEIATNLPAIVETGDFGQLVPGGIELLTGIGKLETVVITVTVPSGSADQSAIIRTWSCIEYQTNPAGLLNDYARVSPPLDPLALEYYRKIANNIPPAVAYYDNEGFWDVVKRIIGIGTGIATSLSVVPGPIGQIAGGLSTIGTAIHRM